MNTTGRSLLVSLLALGLAACGGAAETSSDVVRTDSAGVRLITSGARDTVLPWTFKEIDVLRDSDKDGGFSPDELLRGTLTLN